MTNYTIYIEGLNKEVVVAATDEKAAYRALWESLPSNEKDCVVSMDAIDEEPA